MKPTPALKHTAIAFAVIAVLQGCAGQDERNDKNAANVSSSDNKDQTIELLVETLAADSAVTAPPALSKLEQAIASLPENEEFVSHGAASDRDIALSGLAHTMSRTAGFVGRRMSADEAASSYAQSADRENYAHLDENAVKVAANEPVSTFSIDVDSGSYSNVRRFLNDDTLPPQDAVRVEELLNYFSYSYPVPAQRQTPFSVSTELAITPWNKDTWLMQIGLKGFEITADERPASNLVFLLDVSGSMNSADKLPLLQKSFKLLTRQLNKNDRISIVVYAGASGVVLAPTAGDQRHKILEALDKLHAGGSTNGADGIRLAYQLAEEAYIDDGINRIILATDGDFNVGTVNFEQLLDLAERKLASGVSLTTLGFGTGNYNDHLMEQLADAGNGNYAYIDSMAEARKVLLDELSSTLFTIAKDVKIQVEFNPDLVAEYRLIGYENRALNREDFNNDKVDAGEIGAGHTVTALYEITPVASDARLVDPLRYGDANIDVASTNSTEVAFVKLRYKQPEADISQLLSYPVYKSSLTGIEQSSENLRFAAAVAAFGQQLKGSAYTGSYSFDEIYTLAKDASSDDRYEYRAGFLGLVQQANRITQRNQGVDRDDHAIAIVDN